ncbi:MAG: hypothetical protein ACR2P3_03950 [Geminicoccaceae bacterium]
MTYEPYDPKGRQITPRTHVVSWVLCGLLIAILIASSPIAVVSDSGKQVAGTDAMNQDCG